ncbi:MAG TPA: complex I NDUFA9 subunit family protein [Steroidobacteraceae bacterium]|nr:complex I NDUFA9 subunit family protein [Steroidobacteraceae bacterium]
MNALAICVLGGTGFVGSRLVTRLVAAGHRVTVLTRNRERHRDLLVLPELNLVNANVHDAGELAVQFSSAQVVINLVGILNEGGRGASFQTVHTELARKVAATCRSAGVTRLLHMSSLGADAQAGPSRYLRTKGEAEQIVRAECGDSVDFTIFRPSVIFGPGDSFINRFARLTRLLPLAFPLARSSARFAPVYVGDVVEAMMRCLRGGVASEGKLELCGPDVFTLREIVAFTADTLRLRRWVVGLPDFLGRMQGVLLGWLPGTPFSLDNFRSLTVDSVCAESGFAFLGIEPQSMPGIVRQYLGAKSSSGLLDDFRESARRA